MTLCSLEQGAVSIQLWVSSSVTIHLIFEKQCLTEPASKAYPLAQVNDFGSFQTKAYQLAQVNDFGCFPQPHFLKCTLTTKAFRAQKDPFPHMYRTAGKKCECVNFISCSHSFHFWIQHSCHKTFGWAFIAWLLMPSVLHLGTVTNALVTRLLASAEERLPCPMTFHIWPNSSHSGVTWPFLLTFTVHPVRFLSSNAPGWLLPR